MWCFPPSGGAALTLGGSNGTATNTNTNGRANNGVDRALSNGSSNGAGSGVSASRAPAPAVAGVEYPANLTLANIAYFTVAPTLCYELEYPRNATINWR